MLFAEAIYLLVLFTPELNLISVVNVFHTTPRGITLNIALILWHAELWCTLLKLYGIATCLGCTLNKLLGNLHRAIMIDTNFSNDKDGMSIPDHSVTYSDFRHTLLWKIEPSITFYENGRNRC